MQEIKCPKCGAVFTVDESGYAAIVKQVHDKEFNAEIKRREESFESEKKLAVAKAEAEKDRLISELKTRIASADADKEKALAKKDIEIERLKTEKATTETQHKNELELINDAHVKEIRDKDILIGYYKDLKTKMSTKMVGETLEQHCSIEFNKIRATAFPDAYFEKDNDAKSGSKGDFIFRDYSNGVEYISIMFEMKNENDTTATKHKNEDFFAKLDKDRINKKCEYAVLVSMLEADNERYNTGIVDVSYKYEKMYVIRPQFFIPMITILRNAAMNTLQYKRQLTEMRNQDIDITHFEEKIEDFKKGFSRNYDLASKQFDEAIKEIDKSIAAMTKVKEKLESSLNNLRLANDKAQKQLTIKSLTKGNETMIEMFGALENEE